MCACCACHTDAVVAPASLAERRMVLTLQQFVSSCFVNPSTPTVATWVQLYYTYDFVPDRVKPSFVIFDTRAL